MGQNNELAPQDIMEFKEEGFVAWAVPFRNNANQSIMSNKHGRKRVLDKNNKNIQPD